ncbi:MAG TPA: hypothetical protein VJA22_00950 [Patescibacteria group bacterium]|nr:hypothetical protein [Patescibacteria group bacterium]
MNVFAKIIEKKSLSDGWEFLVLVDEIQYNVHLTTRYYLQMTFEKVPPEELVVISFDYLLAHESKESILRQFDLSAIKKYFPDYEEEMHKRFREI